MNNLIDVYNKLQKDYQVEWIGENKQAFNLYFFAKNSYKIYVDECYISISKMKKIFKYRYWKDLGRFHNDFNTSNFDTLYSLILNYISMYTN